MSLTNWELFHRYRKLVISETVKPLRCPDCETVLVTRIGKDDEPMLQCFGCGSRITPGLDLIQQVRAVVAEHYQD